MQNSSQTKHIPSFFSSSFFIRLGKGRESEGWRTSPLIICRRVRFRFCSSRTFSVAKAPQIVSLPKHKYLKVMPFTLPTVPGTRTKETKRQGSDEASSLVRRQRHGLWHALEEGLECGGAEMELRTRKSQPATPVSSQLWSSGLFSSPITPPWKPPATPVPTRYHQNYSTKLIQEKSGSCAWSLSLYCLPEGVILLNPLYNPIFQMRQTEAQRR